ncbi:MAG: hypothetical protein JJ974_09810 [Phycisphaerales bacterium]|nr:hypothetical protein [Phycisphaerales bacterium]
MGDSDIDASQEIRDLLLSALRLGQQATGYVFWAKRAAENVAEELGVGEEYVLHLFEKHVDSGGRVKYKVDKRDTYAGEMIGNAVVDIVGVQYFIEFNFGREDLDDPELFIVSAHPSGQ